MTEIIAHFQEEKGHHFDPDLVDYLLANLEEFKEIGNRFSDIKSTE